MTNLEYQIRASLARTAHRAPTSDEVVERIRRADGPHDPVRRPRGPGVFTTVGVAAAVLAVIVGAVWLDRQGDSLPIAQPGPVGHVTANPSTHPDIELCESLASQLGAEAELQRAVTLPTGAVARWLASQPAPTPTLVGYGLSTSATPTSICVFSTTSIPLDAPADKLSAAAGQILIAQSRHHFALAQTGGVTDLVHHLDALQRQILQKFQNRPFNGLEPPPWQQPCPGAQPTTLQELANRDSQVRVPNTVLTNAGTLTGLYQCGYEGLPELRYGTIKVYFETGWGGHDWERLWKNGLLKDQPGWYTTTFGNPTLILHPVNGTFGEVMYVQNGTLMRVLGDGSVPALQLLNVVRSSRSLSQS